MTNLSALFHMCGNTAEGVLKASGNRSTAMTAHDNLVNVKKEAVLKAVFRSGFWEPIASSPDENRY